ncbi:VCBS repeat-containing protein [Microbacterium sp. X-17]|uniref:VCBS repeat-containing protein n=1 Tax=Microbacterium sp. X-17 TaxID=3144404 RepID=UPI0031F59CF8
MNVRRARRAGLGIALTVAMAGAAVLATGSLEARPAHAATAKPSTVTTDFFYYTGTQGSYAVPAGISKLTVELSGGASTPIGAPTSSRSGHMVIDLGTTYAGQTLTYLVGGNGLGSAAAPVGTQNAGGGGTYLAAGNTLLAVAGGGGGNGGDTTGQTTTTTIGGTGGYVNTGGTAVAGTSGAAGTNPQAVGGGASGTTPGTPGTSSTGTPETTGSAGGATASVSNGVIQPALGGYGAPGAGGGGGGYTGGGGGSVYAAGGTTSAGAGGGGSGYVAPGIPVTSSSGTSGLGIIAFRFYIDFSLTVTPTSVAGGSALTATVTGLTRQNWFSLRLDSMNGPLLFSGLTDRVGGATVSVTIPPGTSPGDHVLHLLENATEGGGGTQGDSNPFTVTATVWRLHDFNGDGHPDVMARDAAGGLQLYRGDGSGGWGRPAATQVGSGWNLMTAVIAPGDFNGDGHPDLLARDSAGALWLYPGDGSGGWGTRSLVGTGWNIMRSIIAVGDFTGDGNPDVMGIATDGTLRLYPGDGHGGWGSPAVVGSGWGVMSAVFSPGDFDGDGSPDLLARDAGGRLLLYGHSPAGWTSVTAVGWGWNGMSAILSVGDFDGDGTTDVIARDSGGDLWLYPTDGDGGWGDPYPIGSGWNGMSWIG